MAQSFNLKAVISAVDRVTGPMKKINAALRSPIKAVRDVATSAGSAGAAIGNSLGPLAAITGGAGIGGLALGLGKMVSVNAQFEDFQATLETIEGSVDKARSSLAWVSDFAATTPFQMDQVTDAFVKLKAYGIDPQAGALKAAGDAAAAMGKPLEAAVEAMADAMTGENERLKEFGIKAETVGNKISYHWRENGKRMAAVVNKDDTDAILRTVEGIWKSRFDGAMERRSKTWNGMWSNMQDIFSMFMTSIGNAGIFDVMKGELQGVLDTLGQWQKDGTIKKVAAEISGVLTAALKDIKGRLASVDWKAAWEGIKNFGRSVQSAVDAVGGWGNALIILAVIINAQTLVAVVELMASVGRLGMSLVGLGVKAIMALVPMLASFGAAMLPVIASTWAWTVALLANPMTWIVLGVVALMAALFALAAGIAWVVTHWDKFKAAVVEVGEAIQGAFSASIDWAAQKLAGFISYATQSWENLKAFFSGDFGQMKMPTFDVGVSSQPPVQAAVKAANTNVPAAAVAAANTNIPAATGAPAPVSPGAPPSPALMLAGGRMGGAGEARVVGEVVMRFENAPQGFRVSDASSNQPGLHLRPDVGYRMMSVVGG